MKELYFDYAATTPVMPEILAEMQRYMTVSGGFANPSNTFYRSALDAEEVLLDARLGIGRRFGFHPHEILWTSGATEANNLAIKGLLLPRIHQAIKDGGKMPHAITFSTEHKAVLKAFEYCADLGAQVTVLPVDASGSIDLDILKEALRDETCLVSCMWVNNETGVIHPIQSIGAILKDHGAFFHVDAAQALGKLDVAHIGDHVDAMSLSAHKCYGPKGIGALLIKDKMQKEIEPQIVGGSQEFGFRAGTTPVHQVVGFYVATEWVSANFKRLHQEASDFSQTLASVMRKNFAVDVHGDNASRVPHILNLGFHESMDLADQRPENALIARISGLAVSNGSACNTKAQSPSHVLSAMGVSDWQAMNSLRFSFGHYTQPTDVPLIIEAIYEVYNNSDMNKAAAM